MVANFVYWLAGVPFDKVQYTSGVLDEITIKRNGLNVSIQDLRVMVQKDLKSRIVHKSEESCYIIDQQIEVRAPYLKDAILMWSSISGAAQNVKKLSIIAGIGILVVGGWKSISDQSPLKTLGTIVLVYVSAYFARQAQLIENAANETWWTLGGFYFANFRMGVIKNGLASFSYMEKLLPQRIRNRAMELISDQEIKELFKEYLGQIDINDLIDKKSLLDDPYRLFAKLPKEDPFRNKVRKAIRACYKFIYNEGLSQERRQAFDDTRKECQTLFANFKDESGNFLPLFKKRFETLASASISDENENHIAMEAVLRKYLIKLSDSPAYFKSVMEIDAKNKYVKYRLKSIFKNVFNREGVENYEAYIKWARGQFETIPDERRQRHLLSILSKASGRDE